MQFTGENLHFEDIVFPYFYFPSEKNEVAVTEVAYYDKNGQIYKNTEGKSVFVTAKVENRSGTEYINQPYKVYAVKNSGKEIISGIITLPVEGSNYINFFVSEPDWDLCEEIIIVFEQ